MRGGAELEILQLWNEERALIQIWLVARLRLHLANYLAPILSAKTIPRKAAQCLVDLKSVHCVANRDKVEKNGHLLGKGVSRSMSHIKVFVAFNLLRWSLNSADIFDLGRGPRIPDLQFRV